MATSTGPYVQKGQERQRLTPEFRWAQRKGDVYITMNVANVRPEQTTARITDDGHVYWRGYGGVLGDEREYVLDIRLLKPIKTAESSIKLSSRLVYFKIRKAESGPYWDRLLADESRNVHCKIDWDAWKDEDEEDDYDFGSNWGNKDLADLDFGNGDEDSSDSGEEN